MSNVIRQFVTSDEAVLGVCSLLLGALVGRLPTFPTQQDSMVASAPIVANERQQQTIEAQLDLWSFPFAQWD